MLVQVLVVACVLSSVKGNEVFEENPDGPAGMRYARSLQLPGGGPRNPMQNGISGLTNIFMGGLQAQQRIFQGGINTMVGQFNNMTNQVQQTAANAIATGENIIRTAAEKISLPGIAMASTLAIGRLNSYLRMSGKDVQTLPPLNTTLMGFATLITSEGRLSRLSTVVSDGSVRVNVTARATRISIPIRLQELRVTFQNYTFNTWGMNLAGNLSVNVRDNGLVVHISALTSGCFVNVERIETVRFKDIDVQITGLCSWCSSLANVIVNYLQSIIQAEVQKAMDDGLKQLLKEDSAFFCSRLTS